MVDLWAPWCGPCKTLGPIIERVVDEHRGPGRAWSRSTSTRTRRRRPRSGCRASPRCTRCKDGKVVDGFVGAQGETEVAAFVERLLPSEAEIETGRLLAAGRRGVAAGACSSSIPANEHGHRGPGRARWSTTSRADEALELLDRIPETAATRRVAALARAGDVVDELDDVGPTPRRPARPGQGRRRGPPGVRRPARAARPRRPPHRPTTAASSPPACTEPRAARLRLAVDTTARRGAALRGRHGPG